MLDSDEEFFEELRKAFAVEAQDHLETITQGLLSMEEAPEDSSSKDTLEQIFRAAHSLKGAARAVNLSGVGSICQSLETVFSALQKGSLKLQKHDYDTLQQASGMLEEMLFSSQEKSEHSISMMTNSIDQIGLSKKPSSDRQPLFKLPRKEQSTEEQGETRQGILKEVKQDSSHQLDPVEDSSSKSPEQPSCDDVQADRSRPVMPDTIRVAASRLDFILMQSEELISIKLSSEQRLDQLREILEEFRPWKKEFSRISTELHARTHGSQMHSAFDKSGVWSKDEGIQKALDWSYSKVVGIESALQKLRKTLVSDMRSTKAMVDHVLDGTKSVLMLPFETLTRAFPKMVRDIARGQGKDAQLQVQGGQLELDKRILERIKDPLIHLVRNCVDHGLEEAETRQKLNKPEAGRVLLSISQVQGNMVRIEIRDDGRGIDVQKVKDAAVKNGLVSQEKAHSMDQQSALDLIFQSGISTSPIITDISGRGLGMAIVREAVDNLGGSISIETTKDAGTVYTILMPMTIAAFRGILVRECGHIFFVPTSNVDHVFRLGAEEVSKVENRETISFKGAPLSLVRLGILLGLDFDKSKESADESRMLTVVVMHSGQVRIAFVVDEIIKEQEVLFKSFGRQLKRVRNVSGATVLGSGLVATVLNVSDLLRSAAGYSSSVSPSPDKIKHQDRQKDVLVAEDSITSRMLLKNILTSAGYRVKTVVDGVAAYSALREETFDLVVSDVEMPGMNGFQLTEKIRSTRKTEELPVVLVTSLESREDRKKGIDVGADAYIVKSSFDQSNLIQVVKRLCG